MTQDLDLKRRRLVRLPSTATSISKIVRKLNVSHNELATMSDLIQFENLEELHLNHNLLEEFPVELQKLPNLKVLLLNHNKIRVIPEWIVGLEKLQVLQMHHNPLEDIPLKHIASMPQLVCLGFPNEPALEQLEFQEKSAHQQPCFLI